MNVYGVDYLLCISNPEGQMIEAEEPALLMLKDTNRNLVSLDYTDQLLNKPDKSTS